jgi:hypothetical protein
MRRTQLAIAYTALAVAGLAAVTAYARPWVTSGGRSSTSCSERIPDGQSVAAAWRTAELFVADVILGRRPACSGELSTQAFRRQAPVRAFSSRYPIVPIARASRDPGARQAVYMLSRRTGGLMVTGKDGRPEIPFMVGLAAPDAGRGAFDLVLVVEHGNWRVDRVRRVELVDR